tara:strand:+ start:1625 stop:4126 length:2502 start_codon:yes stop_codon:yes gene_type:complete
MPVSVSEKNYRTLLRGSSKFDIPYFQRTYSWEKPQIEKFCQDLSQLKKDNADRRIKSTFIGSMLISDEVSHEGYTATNILDGQQRLTTTLLFGLALQKKAYILHKSIVEENLGQDDNRLDDVQVSSAPGRPQRSPNEIKQEMDAHMRGFFFPLNSNQGGNNFILSPAASDRSQWNKIFEEEFIEKFFEGERYQLEAFSDGSDDLDTQKLTSAWKQINELLEKTFFKTSLTSEGNQKFNHLLRVSILFEILMNKFQLAVIQVDPFEDDIEEVFISLNSEGMELSALDHIRTFLWKGLESDRKSNFLEKFKKFEKKFTAPFVNMEGTPSLLGNKRNSHIKNFWFPYGKTFTNLKGDGKSQAKDLDTSWSNLFGRERGYDRSAKILKHMNFYVEIYNLVTQNYIGRNSTIGTEHPELVKKLRNMQYWNPASACFPYIFEASKYYINEANEDQKKDIENSFDIIESFIMRRYLSITGETIKETLHSLYKRIENYDFDFKMVRKFIEDERIKFISDEEIKEYFENNEYSNSSKGLRYLLMKYESKNTGTENEREENYRQWDAADKFDVDHFMPKNAISTEYWKDHLKESNWDLFFTNEDDEEVLDQNKYKKECGNIGNLMLLSSSANRQKKDKGFEASKEIINNQLLSVTKDFINNLDAWKKEYMQSRQEDLYDFFITQWPLYEDEKTYGEEKIRDRSQAENSNNSEIGTQIRERMNQLNSSVLAEYTYAVNYQPMNDDLKRLLRNNDLLADSTRVVNVRFNIWSGSDIDPEGLFKAKKVGNNYQNDWDNVMNDYFDSGTNLCWFWERYDVSNLNVIDLNDDLAWENLMDHISPEEDV